MKDLFRPGDKVILRCASGDERPGRVVSVSDGRVYATNEQEWLEKGAETVVVVGFPGEDVRHA